MDIFSPTQKMIFYSTVFIFMILPSIHPVIAEEVPYGIGSWEADSLGNHRAVIHVSKKADAVWAHIPWRRRDFNPEKKNIIIIDAKTDKHINNMCRVDINREFGDLIFQPQTIPGKYYIYYMPYSISGRRNYPTVIYQDPEYTAEAAWLQRNGLTTENLSRINRNAFSETQVVEIQSIDEFNSFYPMEVIATTEEIKNLLAHNPESPYLLFPEDRKYPVRMFDDLPLRWIKSGPQNHFQGDAARGEFYAFQIGVYACREAIADIDLHFSRMKCSAAGTVIPASLMCCINTGGNNWNGEEFKKVCAVEKGKVYPLWCGIQIPADVSPGKYEGVVTVSPNGMKETQINIVLNVTNDVLKDAGDSELWRHSRLRWLDSRIAFDDDIVPPFTPMTAKSNMVSCLGRSVTIGKAGFPKHIQSMFSPEVTHLLNKGRDILCAPIELVVEDADGNILSWIGEGVTIKKRIPGAIAWEAKSEAGALILNCQARMEFDGFIEFKVKLSALKTMRVKDIRLEIPIFKNVAKYMMGMGHKGGFRPAQFQWKWDQKKNQDSVWIGDVNTGMQCSFRAENYSRPLNTNFYLSKPLNMPPSWYNDGKGGCTIKEKDNNIVLISAYSGERSIQTGEELYFHFNLLLTPFKTLDTKGQWVTRFYHSYKPIEEIAKTGANTINNHHANEVNPYINYPFIHTKQMKDYVDEAHDRGIKVKIYYTIRELSNHAVEIFALRSLGSEIFSHGPGGGYSWLQEHLGLDYIAAWFVPQLKDAAVINSGMSRWHNYYLEGLNWLVKNIEIDGLYIDDVAYDRTTMKRVRKILDRGCDSALIDLHSANQFNNRDGFASSANLYLEHFPYLNRIWFGEYFDYDSSPDHWLVEMSGIPFGVMGEMLQGGGNQWRGMLYGMTSRLPWAGDPTHIWKVWDDFGIQDSDMIGYWASSCPVKLDSKDVLATAYVKKDSVLISIASWAKETVDYRLKIDWEALGLDPEKSSLRAPAIKDFQDAAIFKPLDRIPVESGKGWLLILK